MLFKNAPVKIINHTNVFYHYYYFYYIEYLKKYFYYYEIQTMTTRITITIEFIFYYIS